MTLRLGREGLLPAGLFAAVAVAVDAGVTTDLAASGCGGACLVK